MINEQYGRKKYQPAYWSRRPRSYCETMHSFLSLLHFEISLRLWLPLPKSPLNRQNHKNDKFQDLTNKLSHRNQVQDTCNKYFDSRGSFKEVDQKHYKCRHVEKCTTFTNKNNVAQKEKEKTNSLGKLEHSRTVSGDGSAPYRKQTNGTFVLRSPMCS